MLNAIRSLLTTTTNSSTSQAPVTPEAPTTKAAEKYTVSSADPAVISIKANYTTPYRWKVSNAPQGLEISEKYTRDARSANLMGAGGTLELTIKPGTCKPGKYLVQLGNFRLGSDTAVNTRTVEIEVKAADNTMTLSNGESATVEIPANYTTPFQWKVISAPEGMSVGHKYTSKPNPNRMMGVGGKVTFTITPESCAPGTYVVELGNFHLGNDDQPWNTRSVEVVVK